MLCARICQILSRKILPQELRHSRQTNIEPNTEKEKSDLDKIKIEEKEDMLTRPRVKTTRDRREYIFLAAGWHLKSVVRRAAASTIIGTNKLSIQYLDYIISKPITDVVSRAIETRRKKDPKPIKLIIFLDKP